MHTVQITDNVYVKSNTSNVVGKRVNITGR